MLKYVSENTIYKVVSGSRSYGLDTADSDHDVLGVFVHRPEVMLGISSSFDNHVKSDVADENYKSFKEFIKFARDGSLFWVEPLFVRNQDILKIEPCFQPFVEQRDIFLTKALVKKGLGYINGMIQSANKIVDDNSNDTKVKQRRKNVSHAVRVSYMVNQFLDTGELVVYRIDERERLLKIKNGIININEATDELTELISEIERKLKIVDIPEIADENILSSLLVLNTKRYWSDKKWI